VLVRIFSKETQPPSIKNWKKIKQNQSRNKKSKYQSPHPPTNKDIPKDAIAGDQDVRRSTANVSLWASSALIYANVTVV
jgi:hypothetical protein